MKLLLLVVIVVGAGLYLYPAWHEDTANVCEALDHRAAEIVSARGQDNSSGLIRNASGGIVAAEEDARIPGLPASLGCVVRYWQLTLVPNLETYSAPKG